MDIRGLSLPGIKEVLLLKGQTATGSDVSLKPGDTVQARVVASSNNSVVLNIGGTRIPASTDISLNAGQILSLMVVELGPDRIVLRQVKEQTRGALPAKYSKDDLVDYLLKGTNLKQGDLQGIAGLIKGAHLETGKEFAALKGLIATAMAGDELPDGFDFARLMQDIDELIVDSGDKKQVLARIRSMVEAISHEANLVAYLAGSDGEADNITARLLEAQSMLQNKSQIPLDLAKALSQSTERLLELVTTIKLLNLPVDSQAREFIYLPIPVRVGDHVMTAEVKIYAKGSREQRASGQNPVYTIGFALDMPSLGATRALVEVADPYINVGLAVENIKALDRIDELFEELKGPLEELGYIVGRLSAAQLKPEPDRSLIEDKLGVSQEGIDIKA
ncbi:MAG TPA: hypothetical protein VGK02_11045 [Candidatus Aquicultor sp.]|jgi:hypothetical protein